MNTESTEFRRANYLGWGLLLGAVKWCVDYSVAVYLFGREWSVLNYFVPGRVFHLWSARDEKFCLAMLALALPFIVAGVTLTMRRLRALRWPVGLVVLFFVPLVNFVLFTLLCVVLPRSGGEMPAEGPSGGWHRWVPESRWGSATLGMVASLLLGLGATVLSTNVFREYGFGLFVLVPVCCGWLSALLHGCHRPRRLGECVSVAVASVVLLGLTLVAFAIEGAVCIVMAAPLGIALAIVGGIIGYLMQRHGNGKAVAPPVAGTMGAIVPLLIAVEHVALPEAPLFEVRTTVEVRAPAERVWPEVVAFAELPMPTEWIFRIGIAYPTRAEIRDGIRYCIFSTGAFVEPIEIWDEPRLLRFGVTQNPPPMQEWTPYREIHPPHLDGFLAAERGQFLLVALPGGRTRLEGTTWYRHHLWPAEYWRVWSDAIIHGIHLRVLEQIKRRSEGEVSGAMDERALRPL